LRHCLVVALLLVAACRACQADELSEIVGRYAEWRGGARFEQLQSIKLTGVLDEAGLHGTESMWEDRIGRQRVDIDLGVIKQTQAIALTGAWDKSLSGQIESLSLADRHNLTRQAALQFVDALRGRGGATAALAEPQVRKGRTWAVVRVRFGDDDVYDVLVDPKTGELGGFHITEDRAVRFEDFGDWRVVDGVRMPFLQTEEDEATNEQQILRIATLTLNTPIPEDKLARPAPVRNVTFKGGATSTGWIDFEFFNNNRIFLPARVNGHKTLLLLDSGATVSAVDKTYAAALGLIAKGNFKAPGAGGIDTTGFTGGVEIEIGPMALHDVKVATFDLMPVAKRIGHPIPFVLGNEVFNAFAVDIDFAHRRLALRDPDTLVKPADAVEVPLVRIKDRSVPVSIEGAPPVLFEFDLGDGSPLDIYPTYYTRHGLLKGRKISAVEAGGVGGFHSEAVAVVRSVAFAGVELDDVPANFSPDTPSANNSNLLLGSLGLPLAARFHLVIDYSHDRLFATPDAAAIGTPFAKDRLGMNLVREAGAVTVSFVSPGGPAERAGLKAGDQVRAIDGKLISHWSEAAIAELRFQAAGTTVTLTLADGAVRTVTRRDFF
jgi:hypothetical protein